MNNDTHNGQQEGVRARQVQELPDSRSDSQEQPQRRTRNTRPPTVHKPRRYGGGVGRSFPALEVQEEDVSIPSSSKLPIFVLTDDGAAPSRQTLAVELADSLTEAGVPAAEIAPQVDLMLDMMAPETTVPDELDDLSEPLLADIDATPSHQMLAVELADFLAEAGVPTAEIAPQVDLMLDMIVPETTLPDELDDLSEPLLADADAPPSRQTLAAELAHSLAEVGVPAAEIAPQVDLMLDMMAPETTVPDELPEPLLADADATPSRQQLAAELALSLEEAGVPAAEIAAQVDLMLQMMEADITSLSTTYPNIINPQ